MNIANYNKCVKFALNQKDIKGDSFKDTVLRVYERNIANPGTIFTSLRKGDIIIPVVSMTLFDEYKEGLTAIVVIKTNQVTGMVDLYIPNSDDIKVLPISSFIDTWESAGNICTTDFDGLRETIAENTHDRWT